MVLLFCSVQRAPFITTNIHKVGDWSSFIAFVRLVYDRPRNFARIKVEQTLQRSMHIAHTFYK